jgi:hypothetical protein
LADLLKLDYHLCMTLRGRLRVVLSAPNNNFQFLAHDAR